MSKTVVYDKHKTLKEFEEFHNKLFTKTEYQNLNHFYQKY